MTDTENPFSALYRAYCVPQDYDGPLAREFHDMIARQWLRGMRGGHTSLGPQATPEGLVRTHLSINWQETHGHTFAVQGLDEPTLWDRVRSQWCKVRRFLSPNPYV